MKIQLTLHPDLLTAQNLAYEPCGFTPEHIVLEAESQEYGACRFTMNNKQILFRVTKITPTKVGQFVTFWKRIGNGPIMPFDESDPIDLFVISVRAADPFGQFVFPKHLLIEQGFVSVDGKGGKRAMRVYPPWDLPNSRQAQRTQSWQLKYFFEIQPTLDSAGILKLYNGHF